MKKNNKGFTLLELMAVIIVLITITLLALFKINRQVEASGYDAFIKDANQIAIAAQTKHDEEVAKSIDGIIKDDIYNGTVEGKVCYSVKQALMGKYVDKPKGDYSGSIEICYGDDCTYEYKLWLTDGTHFIDGKTKFSNRNAVSESFTSNTKELSCNVESAGAGGVRGSNNSFDYDFEGDEEIFEVQKTGIYAIEAWGAQGGNSSNGAGYTHKEGGYGGYTYAEYKLKKGQILYIKVGEKGQNYTPGNLAGSAYNGGHAEVRAQAQKGGGGGATSITTKQIDISNININRKEILAIAGGGAGSDSNAYNKAGASGGGYCDSYGEACYNTPKDQNRNNYGQGGGYTQKENCGGTGYYNAHLAKNGVMFTYNGYTNSSPEYKTLTTSNYSDEAISNYVKRGNGHARIKLLSDYSTMDNNVIPQNIAGVTPYYYYGTQINQLTTNLDASHFKSDHLEIEDYTSYVNTEFMDLSNYKSVIMVKSGTINPRNFYIQDSNNNNILTVSFENIGNNLYVYDISSVTNTNARFAFNSSISYGNTSNAGNLYYLAFSTKTVEEIKHTDTFDPNGYFH